MERISFIALFQSCHKKTLRSLGHSGDIDYVDTDSWVSRIR